MAEAPVNRASSDPERPGYARSKDTRARILAAALAEAGEVGFHKTSVTRIAARAGVALGNVNYHFGSKSKLLHELMATLVADLSSRIHVSLPADSDDFFDQEHAGLLAYLAYLRENPAYARLADEVKLHEPQLYSRAFEGWIEIFAARIRDGIEQGSIRSMGAGEVRALAHVMYGAHQFLDRLIDSDDDPGDAAIAQAYLGFVRAGLGASA
jgi:AcrR family transcriptional regulator